MAKDYSNSIVNGVQILSETDPLYGKNSMKIRRYYCICIDCGEPFKAIISNVIKGQCCRCPRCTQKDLSIIRTTHGKSHSRLYKIWISMNARCHNPHDASYNNYGGRGIHVCDEWRTRHNFTSSQAFMNFYKWAYANGYYEQPKNTPWNELLSIERKDVNSGYSPENCEWVPMIKQSYNRTTTRFFIYFDRTITAMELFEKYHISRDFIYNKKKKGWSDNAILYAILHLNDGIHKHNGMYYDKDGFMVLIPNYGN